jgi:signal transduction histidine kinase
LHFDFFISQPLWKKGWFITAVFLLLLFLLVWIIRFYYKQLLMKKATALEKEQAVEKERTRIATDMHDDFGAALSRIKFLSEKIQLNRNEKDSIQSDLQKISFYSDEMADKMGEIVWALNQRYDSVGDLVSFSRSYASEFLQDKSITLHFFAEGLSERKIHGEWRRNIFLVIKESLNNIVKHAQASEVWLRFEESDILNVSIRDNGIGIDTSHIRPFANGLENMRKRIAGIGGTIEIRKENGTLIQLSVPL